MVEGTQWIVQWWSLRIGGLCVEVVFITGLSQTLAWEIKSKLGIRFPKQL